MLWNTLLAAIAVLLLSEAVLAQGGNQPLTAPTTSIHEAVKADDVQRVAELLLHDPALTNLLEEPTKRTPLHYAASRGNYAVVTLLLPGHGNINAQDAQGSTALLLAVAAGHEAVTERLLQHRADPDIREHDAPPARGLSPLHHAVLRRSVGLATLLLNAGAQVDSPSAYEPGLPMTPLFLAVLDQEPSRTLITLLLSRGANPNARAGFQPLLWRAFLHSNDNTIINLLLAYGADINSAESHERVTLLHMVAHDAGIKRAAFLIANGARIDCQDKYGDTPLHRAVANGQHEAVKFFLLLGADVNVKNRDGKTPVDLAVEKREQEIVELLRQHGGTRSRTQ